MRKGSLHSKRKHQNKTDLQRKSAKREPYDFVLIVCEGTETEPNYMRSLCNSLRLNNANFKIVGRGTDPLTLVNYALEVFEEDGSYDRVYCIFDKDQHATYDQAISKAQSLCQSPKNSIPLYVIISIPCVEYWFLLHYIETDRPYVSVGNKTAGEILKSELKKHIPEYDKGRIDVFEKTKSFLQLAIKRAKRVKTQQEQNGTDNPSTNMHELIEYLMNIKQS